MELRDWFAGMALQGLLASDVRWAPQEAVRRAWGHADIMLEERNGEQN
jgi:hypothetical protein